MPATAGAQSLSPAVIAIVDLDRVTAECNACKTATAALKSQVTSLQSREKTLAAPLETEQKSIQAAINALAGKAPDATLQNRVKAFEAKRQQAAQQMSTQQQQISAKLGPVYQQIMQRRGANVMVERGATLAATASVDVTTDVVTALNAALPSIATTAPQSQQPQGR